MRTIFTIVKKELKRFFSDPRMLVSLFLPGILIYGIYSVMGGFITDSMTTDEYNIYNKVLYHQLNNTPQEYCIQ